MTSGWPTAPVAASVPTVCGSGNQVFACTHREQLMIKLPADEVDELICTGLGAAAVEARSATDA